MMSRSLLSTLVPVVLSALLCSSASAQSPGSGQAAGVSESFANLLALPAQTRLQVAVTRPVWARTSKAGDALYLQTVFPVSAGSRIAIPAGTYVRARIEEITRPTRRLSQAGLQVSVDTISLANGYTLSASIPLAARTLATTRVIIQASTANDLLLDNGAQFERTLPSPLSLDAERVAQAMALSRLPQPGSFSSATLCRPAAGFAATPGTADTVIPGSPGTPGTTIPGANGSPDISIPGTPPTPATVIPGTPGSPGSSGSACPAPPVVIGSAPSSVEIPLAALTARAATGAAVK